MENNASFRLTQDQVKAARELYRYHLPNWRLARQAFASLREEGDFKKEEVCLLAVVAVDSLYSTGLRFRPGAWEDLARRICQSKVLLTPGSVRIDLVAQMATEAKAKWNFAATSFFSKFCHYFVSADYPIYDTLARDVLQRKHGFSDDQVSAYPEFVASVLTLQQQVGPDFSMADSYLWLYGKFSTWNPYSESEYEPGSKGGRSKRSARRKYRSEVATLFDKPTETERGLINSFTRGEYEEKVLRGHV